MAMTFRIDDVSVNTNIFQIIKMSKFLRTVSPDCEIWWCINIFCRSAEGSVYPDLPLKNNPKEYFAEVDRMLPILSSPIDSVKFVSHGLFHFDHSAMDYDTQLFSIVPSCRVLKTDIFVPPFNRFNAETEEICVKHGIRLIKGYEEGWKSLEAESFNPDHNLWFFHAWRFSDAETFKERFSASKVA